MEGSESHDGATVENPVSARREQAAICIDDDMSDKSQETSVDGKQNLKEFGYDYQDGDLKKTYTSYSNQILEWMTEENFLNVKQIDGQDNGGTALRRRRSTNKHSEIQKRREKLQRCAEKRETSKRKFDLVEELFQRAVACRLKAMRRIAADPPADRLIGHNMLQYIPAALIKGQLKEMVDYMQKGSSHDLQPSDLESPSLVVASSSVKQRTVWPPETANAMVFLTETNEITEVMADPGPPVEPFSSSRNNEDVVHEDSKSDNPAGLTSSRAALSTSSSHALSQPSEDMLAQWRELGYDAMYITSSQTPPKARRRRAIRNTGTSPGESFPATSGPAVFRTQLAPLGMASERRSGGGVKLDPLPPICLLQRRVEAAQPAGRRLVWDSVNSKTIKRKPYSEHHWKQSKCLPKE